MPVLDPRLQVKLETLEERSKELSAQLAEPGVTSDMNRYRTLTRSYADLSRVIEKFTAYRKTAADLEGAREMLAEAEDSAPWQPMRSAISRPR